MKKLTVQLKKRSYPIYIGAPLEALGGLIARKPFTRRCMLVTNTTIHRHYGARVVRSLQRKGFTVMVVRLPDGEKYKTLESVSKLYTTAVRARLDRRSPVIALGGGVIGDITGFFAATYLRGIPFIQVPTTLLAMVDSSVGGKTGVDLPEGKNLAGAFYQPKMVLIDTATLNTLPSRELKNGMAEVIKYGVIMDRTFFTMLVKNKTNLYRRNAKLYAAIVERCCRLKARVVEQDEYEEKGIRAILNYGHTFGHALETAGGYAALKHGEAVAVGMVFAARLAQRLGLLKTQDTVQIEDLIASAGLAGSWKKINPQRLITVMRRDKKVINGKLRFVLPTAIGTVKVHPGVPEKEVYTLMEEP